MQGLVVALLSLPTVGAGLLLGVNLFWWVANVIVECKEENVMLCNLGWHKYIAVKWRESQLDADFSLYFAWFFTAALVSLAALVHPTLALVENTSLFLSVFCLVVVAACWFVARYYRTADRLCMKCGKIDLTLTRILEARAKKEKIAAEQLYAAREQYFKYLELRKKASC